MKKIITLSTIAFLSTSLYANADMQTQIDELTAKITKMEKAQKKQGSKISKVNKLANKDNIKWDVDFRTSYDNLQYNSVNGNEYKNNALYSMRLWLGMGYAPEDTDMVFKGQLSMNKAFGASYMQRATGHGFDTFDWVRNEQLTDDSVHVREAYWLWTPTIGGFGTTFSIGRRPATNGYLINLRDDDKAKSPMGHVINMEFDGASAGIKLDKFVPGMKFKVCVGRGLTNATSWASQATMAIAGAQAAQVGGTPYPNYAEDPGNLDSTDMAGFIFTPYDDGQYAVEATYYRGFNVPGIFATTVDGATQAPMAYTMQSAGDMDGGAVSFKIEGIGDEINDFLDDTILFASFAMSKSNPEDITRNIVMPNGSSMNMTSASMLGSDESKTGQSYWFGMQIPNMTGGKFGLEYNHGSEHWKPFTFGEDTMIGSKMAVRGAAYETYWTQPIIDDVFSMQIRYTYFDYDYTGSAGFFGDGSTSMKVKDTKGMPGMDAIETASDLRVYFRYRY